MAQSAQGASFDLAIIGGGVAGLTAGLYACRAGLNTVLLERMAPGGQIANAERIENFPGFPDGVFGAELAGLLVDQATRYGLDVRLSEVTALRRENPLWALDTFDGVITSKAVVVAAGSTLRKLGVPGEEELHGAGVSYCATCDGAFFQGEVVGVVGGGDSALDEGLVLTQFASRVVVFCMDARFHAQKVLQDRVLNNPLVEIRWNTAVNAILGEGRVDGVRVTDLPSGETTRVNLSGVFIYVGLEPNSQVLEGLVSLDGGGHVPTDVWMRTTEPGLFAAGDIRQNSAAQLVSSAGDGATAAVAAQRYIDSRDWPD